MVIGLYLDTIESWSVQKAIVSTYFELQCTIDMIKQHLAKVCSDGQVVREIDLATKSDVPPEFVPTSETQFKRFSKRLLLWLVAGQSEGVQNLPY